MNIGALPDLIISWFKNQGLVDLFENVKVQAPSEQFTPGQQYEGQVLENLPNGRSLVQVADQKLDMSLPQQPRPGDIVRLTYVQSGPRPTFVLNSSASTAQQPVTVSQAAQQVSALTRYVPVMQGENNVNPGQSQPQGQVQAQPQAQAQAQASSSASAPASSSASASASSSAPALSSSSTSAQAASVANTETQAAALTLNARAAAVAKPIFSDPAVLLAEAPGNTGTAVATAAGQVLSPAMMVEEGIDASQTNVATNTGSNSAQSVVAKQAAPTQMLPIRLQQTVKESGLFYESHLGKWVRGEMSLNSIQGEPQAALAKSPGPLLHQSELAGMPAKAANLASMQLNMLDGAPFIWLGLAWPGQNMEWQVTEREAGRHGGEMALQKWHSTLRLTLPRLGGVAADLDIGALGLRIRLSAKTPDTLAEMKAALPELAQRMRDSELNLTSLKVGLADGNG